MAYMLVIYKTPDDPVAGAGQKECSDVFIR